MKEKFEELQGHGRTNYTAACEWHGRKLIAVDRWRHDGILVQRSRTLIPFG